MVLLAEQKLEEQIVEEVTENNNPVEITDTEANEANNGEIDKVEDVLSEKEEIKEGSSHQVDNSKLVESENIELNEVETEHGKSIDMEVKDEMVVTGIVGEPIDGIIPETVSSTSIDEKQTESKIINEKENEQ